MGPAYLEQKKAQFAEFAKSWGIEGIDSPERIPNTLRVLALTEHARDEGKLTPLRERAMQAYWFERQFLEDEAVLRELAEHAGLDPERALAASTDPELTTRVLAQRHQANLMGITGIPTFIFLEGDLGPDAKEPPTAAGVVGCQPYEVLEDTMARLREAARTPRN